MISDLLDLIYIFLDNELRTSPKLRILSFVSKNEFNENKMTEDCISFIEDQSKTQQINTPSN